MRIRRRLTMTLARLAGPALVRALHLTVRADTQGVERYERLRREGQPILFALWHGRLLPLSWLHRKEGIVVLVSDHADGEVIARIIDRLGFGLARGSSTRGGVKGLKGLVRAARSGHDLAVTPDGPRGPRHEVKRGLVMAAEAAGTPIVPVAAAYSRSWTIGSWDRFHVPKPFSTMYVEYGEPLEVSSDTEQGREQVRRQVQESLLALTARVDRRAGRASSPGELTSVVEGERHARAD